MKHTIQTAKDYVIDHSKQFALGVRIGIGAVFLIALIALFIYNNPNKIVYQPTDACSLFTPSKAQDLLGDKVIDVNTKGAPVVSGDTATSKCSYTDSNPIKDNMIVAALAIRSGIDDKGVSQNQAEFTTNSKNVDAVDVKDLGDSAYFNKDAGQLNILKGRTWMIISYGVGSTPNQNTVDDAVKLANKILH